MFIQSTKAKSARLRYTLLCLTLVFFILLLTRRRELQQAASNSLLFVANSLIPALFPFAVLSRFVLTASLLPCQNKLSQKAAELFHLAPTLLPAYLVGLFCGFPLGAYAASSLYEAGLCEEKDAHRSAALANNASAAFVFGAASLFQASNAGIVLFVSQTLATLLVSICIKGKQKGTPTAFSTTSPSYLALISDAIVKTALAMLTLAAFVVFFSVLAQALLLVGLPKAILLLLEPTSAVRYAASLAENIGQTLALSLASLALGFSGCSIILQTQALFQGTLSLSQHLFCRIAISLVSFAITFLLASFFCG